MNISYHIEYKDNSAGVLYYVSERNSYPLLTHNWPDSYKFSSEEEALMVLDKLVNKDLFYVTEHGEG